MEHGKAAEKHFLSDPEKILIRKEKEGVFILSRFSENQNVATRFIEGNENSYFLPADAPLEEIFQGRFFAECWDNAAPFCMDDHAHLGANHGSEFTFRVHLLRHWLFSSDTGKVLTDDAGEKFILISVDSLSDFTIHSDVPAAGGKFCKAVTGNLHVNGRTIVPETVTKTQLAAPAGKQLSHHRRYNSIRLLANGQQEISDGETAECDFAELHWDMDLILPETLLSYLKRHPGETVSTVDPRLAGSVHSNMVTTFRPRCARTVEAEITMLQDFQEAIRYGMIQFYGAIGFSDHERLVPGVKEITDAGMNVDLAGTFRFPAVFPVSYYYTRKDCTDQKKLPCRCIDFFGNQGKRELGVVLGYSLSRGITARGREAERSDWLLFLHRTTKIYPFAYECVRAKKGDTFRICAYQQFFAPDASGVSCYHHQEADGYWLYADFPVPTEGYAVSLPAALSGAEMEIAEADRGISVRRGDDGTRLRFDAAERGGIVLRFKTQDK